MLSLSSLYFISFTNTSFNLDPRSTNEVLALKDLKESINPKYKVSFGALG